MWELIGKAWRGWLDFEENNKLTILFFLALLLLAALNIGEKDQRRLMKYSLVMGAACIVPPAAVILMRYQTEFYDYQWIWSMVPFTAMIACGGVLLADRLWRNGAFAGWQKGVLLAGALALVLLCGGNAGSAWDVRDIRQEREAAARTLEALSDGQEGICLWAPEEILEYARSLDGGLTLVYGRNMWREHLNAYSYDTYSQEQRELYAWMSLAQKTGQLDAAVEGGDLKAGGELLPEGTVLKGKDAARTALDLGVNRILLPGCIEEEAITQLEDILQCDAESVEGYYLFRVEDAEPQRER